MDNLSLESEKLGKRIEKKSKMKKHKKKRSDIVSPFNFTEHGLKLNLPKSFKQECLPQLSPSMIRNVLLDQSTFRITDPDQFQPHHIFDVNHKKLPSYKPEGDIKMHLAVVPGVDGTDDALSKK